MATSTPQKATERLVVLLRPSEKLRVKKLAQKQRVSSAEIMRRSLIAYEAPQEQLLTPELVAELNMALDQALTSVRLNLAEIRQSRAAIERMRGQQA